MFILFPKKYTCCVFQIYLWLQSERGADSSWTMYFGQTFYWYSWNRLNYFFLPSQLDHRKIGSCTFYYYFPICNGNMGQNLLNLLQQTWPRGLAAQYCLGGTSTNLMSQKMNAFAIKLSGLDLLYEMQYFFFLSSAVYLHSERCELGWTLVWSFSSKKGGGGE